MSTLDDRECTVSGPPPIDDSEWSQPATKGDVARVENMVVASETRLSARIDVVEARLGGRIDALEAKVDALEAKLGGRIDALEGKVDALEAKLGGRIDALGGKVDSKISTVIWTMIVGYVGILIAFATG